MKKLFIASILFCGLFSSCTTKNEAAYIAETYYKMCKNGTIEASDSTKYKKEFIRIYMNMSEIEKRNYAAYKRGEDEKLRRFNEEYKKSLNEAEYFLNN